MAWPADIFAAEWRFWQDHAQSSTQSPFSLQQKAYTFPGVQWVAEITLGNLSPAQANTFDALLASLNGVGNVVNFAAADVAPSMSAPTARDWYLDPSSPRALKRLPGYSPGGVFIFREAL